MTSVESMEGRMSLKKEQLENQWKALQQESRLDSLSLLSIDSMYETTHRLTGIICTIGPSSRDSKKLVELMVAGMNVTRLNFSHGTHEYHKESIQNIRTAIKTFSGELGIRAPIAIALDTKGPEIRTGVFGEDPKNEVELERGKEIKVTIDDKLATKCSAELLYVDYKNIVKVMKPGNRVYVDDGLISLKVKTIGNDHLICEVENGGKLGSKKGVNLPGVPVDLPAVSEQDKKDLLFGVENDVDMIFASFIRNADGVKQIKKILGDKGKGIKIISKIENQQGMQNIDDIIKASDGIMVARGDLGIEIPTEKVFLAQKAIIAKCNMVGKPVICATQMLESMTYNPRPTRAEATDVANAVLDGADCVMLSGESAKGKFPTEAVKIMHLICREAEAAINSRLLFHELQRATKTPAEPNIVIAMAAAGTSLKVMASAIVVFTESGKMAQNIARFRPRCPIIAVTHSMKAVQQCVIYRGIVPLYREEEKTSDLLADMEMNVKKGIEFAKKRKICKPGDAIVAMVNWKTNQTLSNSIRVITAV